MSLGQLDIQNSERCEILSYFMLIFTLYIQQFKLSIDKFVPISQQNLKFMLNDGSWIYNQFKMNAAVHEGTIIDFNAPCKDNPQQKGFQGHKKTGDPLIGQKEEEYPNPEGQPQDAKKEDSDLRTRMVQIWVQMSNLKKGMIIGGIIVAIVLTILLTLKIVVMTRRPYLVIIRQMVLPVIGTNETISSYEIQATKQNLLSPNKNTNFSMTVITPTTATSRRLEQGSAGNGDVSVVIVQFSNPQVGVSIFATSPEDLIVVADYDQIMLTAYPDRRLLVQAEMTAALRNLQQDTAAPSNNQINLDDPSGILNSAQTNLLKAVAKATNTDQDELTLEYVETAIIQRQSDDTFILEEQPQSSRLLRALNYLRGLQQWDGFFEEVNQKYVTPLILEAKNNINDFISADANVDNVEAKNALKNSNFGDVEVNIVYEEPENTQSRLLQENAQKKTEVSAPSASNSTKSYSNSKPEQKQKKSDGNGKGKKEGKTKVRPLSPKKSKSKNGKVSKSQNTTEKSYNSSTRCTGRGRRIRCDVNVLNKPNSPYAVRKRNNQTQTKVAGSASVYIVSNNGKGKNQRRNQNNATPKPADKAAESNNLKKQETPKKQEQAAKKVEPTQPAHVKSSPQIVANP